MAFTLQRLRAEAAAGEDSTRQFKSKITNVDALAAEMAAFANASGGVIFIGVEDDGTISGIPAKEVPATNQLISNAASQHVRSPLNVQTQNILLDDRNVVIALTVPAGLDKPYFDRKGVIWLKAGADKRRINSKEELRRLFQYTSQFHADELPSKASIDKLDRLLFRDFLKNRYGSEFPDTPSEQLRLLQNLNLAASDGNLNLAGVLLFAERPEREYPQFVAKGVRFPGLALHADRYDDSEDFEGPLSRLFKDSLAFVMRNLYKVQPDKGVNSPGTPEIPEQVFEELLVNALVHRDYLVSAPVRIFIFDDRVEIVSPGTLPNNLTIANIKTGNSNIRNPILISYAAKGLLPYHGIGSGIVRALAAWPDISFEDDREGSLFKAIVHRTPRSVESAIEFLTKFVPKTQVSYENRSVFGTNSYEFVSKIAPEFSALLERIAANPRISASKLAKELNVPRHTIVYRIAILKEKGKLRRIGANRGGYWEIVS